MTAGGWDPFIREADEGTDDDGPHFTFTNGGAFILDTPSDPPVIWGTSEEILWARGESVILTGTAGVGKTTLAQQVVLGLIGLRAAVIGYPVTPAGRVLYLAMDRPRQIARSFRRMVGEGDRATLAERLVIWQGPPPADVARRPGVLLAMADAAAADVVVLDSLKDAAIGLATDEVGAGVNRALQTLLAAGVDAFILHHQTKRSGNGDGGKPLTLADVYGSAWITNGAGSVILLAGDAGDVVVTLSHLKPVTEPVGPLKLSHDHFAGVTTLADHVDALEWLRRQRGPVTVTALAAARDPAAPRPAQEAARRDLERLVRNGLANRHDGQRGGAGGSTPTTYTPAARPGEAALWAAS